MIPTPCVSILRHGEVEVETLDAAGRFDFDATRVVITMPYSRCRPDDELVKVVCMDIKTYLSDDVLALCDRLSMWHSLQLRVPMIDHRLVETANETPSRHNVRFLSKKSLRRQIAPACLPQSLIRHRKLGSATPMAPWLRNDLKAFADRVRSKRNVTDTGLFDHRFVRARLDERYAGNGRHSRTIFSLLMFPAWVHWEQGLTL